MATDYILYCADCKVKSDIEISRFIRFEYRDKVCDFLNRHALDLGCKVSIQETPCYCRSKIEIGQCDCPDSYPQEK